MVKLMQCLLTWKSRGTGERCCVIGRISRIRHVILAHGWSLIVLVPSCSQSSQMHLTSQDWKLTLLLTPQSPTTSHAVFPPQLHLRLLQSQLTPSQFSSDLSQDPIKAGSDYTILDRFSHDFVWKISGIGPGYEYWKQDTVVVPPSLACKPVITRAEGMKIGRVPPLASCLLCCSWAQVGAVTCCCVHASFWNSNNNSLICRLRLSKKCLKQCAIVSKHV